MSNYDVEVRFNLTGANQFGSSETLVASRVHSIEATNEDQAIDVARTIENNVEIVGFSVCKR